MQIEESRCRCPPSRVRTCYLMPLNLIISRPVPAGMHQTGTNDAAACRVDCRMRSCDCRK